MAKYSNLKTLRLDPVSEKAMLKLAEAWQVYNRDGSINESETIRRAIIYSYLVYIKGIDPMRASAELEEYIYEELYRLGMLPIRRKRGRRKIKLQPKVEEKISLWEF